MFLDDVFEHVPDLWATALDHTLRVLDVLRKLKVNETLHDERLEQLKRHELRQTTLVQTKRRTSHDDRTARIVDALSEQVLTETSLLTLQHVGQ